MRIGEADDLPGVAGIGEDFLVAGEAGIENDFAAAASARTRRASLKCAPVLERENRRPYGCLGQGFLPARSFQLLSRRRNRAEPLDRPVGEDGLAVDVAAGHGAKDARVI